MSDIYNKCEYFKIKIQELEEYENKSFFGRLFSSNKPNYGEISADLYEFVTWDFISEISNVNTTKSFIILFEWFNLIKGYLHSDIVFEIFTISENLKFLDIRIINEIKRIRYAYEMQMNYLGVVLKQLDIFMKNGKK